MSRDRADGRASVPATRPAWVPADPGGAMVRRTEVPVPVPHPGEALVAVEAYSVNRGETLLLERPREGWRPGKDLAGTVVRAATDGRGPVAGARVVGHPPAAALPLAGLTALRMVRSAGSLAGRRLLVTGASGGVGHYVVELAARAGAEVSALCASAERGERLRRCPAVRRTTW